MKINIYMFENSESDIVYKMKEKEIYFLIEHQSRIDYGMPKRILEYEVAIIRKAIKGKNLTKKNHKLPRVIPIVIYTGNRKWNVEKYIEECQEILTESNRVKLGEYYVLDVNDYTNEELENDTLFLSTILRLEKAKTEEEIINILEGAIQREKEENKDLLKRIIAFILKGKINEKERESLLKRLEKEEKNMVLEVLRKESERQRREGIREGRKEGIREGIREGKKEGIKEGKKEGRKEGFIITAKKMLERNMKITEIKEITGLSIKEIENLKLS